MDHHGLGHGLSLIVMDCYGSSWIVMECLRSSRIVMDCYGLSWNVIEILLIRYGDLAVGAPYTGVDGVGTVFIFRGGRTGIREEPDQVGHHCCHHHHCHCHSHPHPHHHHCPHSTQQSQVILGSSVRNHIRSFGFSLSGGVDLDSNEYDLNNAFLIMIWHWWWQWQW